MSSKGYNGNRTELKKWLTVSCITASVSTGICGMNTAKPPHGRLRAGKVEKCGFAHRVTYERERTGRVLRRTGILSLPLGLESELDFGTDLTLS